MLLAALPLYLGNMEISPFNRELPLFEALPVPLWDVTISRELRQFKSAVGLSPCLTATPSVNVLAAIVFGRSSFEALVRRELGDVEFRNLRNFARGHVKSPRSLGSILVKCGGDHVLLEHLAAILRDPASSSLVRLVSVIEGAAYRLMLFLRSLHTPCPCCGANTITRSEDWWNSQACNIAAPEAALVDRACMVAVAISFFISRHKDSFSRAPPSIWQLAEASAHPYRNWLESVARIFQAPDLSRLAVRAGADLEPDALWRYARGETLPPEAIEMLISRINGSGAIQAAVIPARTLAFAIEFLRASNMEQPLDDSMARKIVSDRIATIRSELGLLLRDFVHRQAHIHLATPR
ncbi:hypothetical protein RQP54_17900 [Curvibacter sp. APW13]|uniref:hypothetical protein n=1 Tax=Curvibacter sp. APW13 TaxID=3077236 RepID=UPI0028DD870B|nr:hypothetical protein [Curvibacter sp. APW13]MDT8992751.1 hypothetical protein [Curvibacter sp. APW13]